MRSGAAGASGWASSRRGGAGRDGLIGDKGNDVLDGGSGRDYIYSRGEGRDIVRCGPGRDRVEADRRDRLVGCESRSLPRRRR